MNEASGARRGSVVPHLLILGLILIVALALSERSSGFTTDEGSYAIQAEALREGSWSIDWPFRQVDPDGAHFPYHGGALSDEGEFAYVNHPAWPAALAVVSSVIPEEVGLRVLSLLSVLAAAAAAYVLADRFGDGRSARWAFWLVAGSPVLANGLMIWAHAPATALAGLAAICVAQVLDRGRWTWGILLVAVLGTGVLLRSEFVLFAIATAMVVAVVGLVRRQALLTLIGAACGLATAAVVRGERWWISSIVGDHRSGLGLASRSGGSGGSEPWLGGRLQGMVSSLFEGATNSPAALVMSVLMIVCIALVVVNPRRMQLPAEALMWTAVALAAVRLVIAPDEPARGLIAAWPLVLLAVLALRRMGSVERSLFAIVGLYALAVFATQYDDGGGLQWGGRFLNLAIVPLGVAGAAGVGVLRSRVPRCAAPLAALLVGCGLMGLVTTDGVRSGNAGGMAAVASAGPDVVLISNTQIARLDWTGWPERCWLYADPQDVAPTVALLERLGIRSVTYVLFDQVDLRAAGLAPRVVPGDVPISVSGSGRGACPRGRAR